MKSRNLTTEDALRMMKKLGSGDGGGASSLTDLGITATADELNFVKGVTSNIQTQLDGKADSLHNHSATDIDSGTLSSDRLPTVPIAKGGTGATNRATAMLNLCAGGTSNGDLNEKTDVGTYWISTASCTNTPYEVNPNTYGVLRVSKASSALTLQEFFRYNSSEVWRRVYTNSQWYAWSRIDGGNAGADHNHDDLYSKLGHTHTEYVDLTSAQTITAAKTFNGEQKFYNASYCPTITDSASGVGCAFKASRGLFNEALIDKLIMTSSTGKIPFYKYTGTSGGSMTGLSEVASIDNAGLLTCKGIKTTANINGTNEYLTGSLYVGGKTSSTDGKNGLAFGSSGSLYMQGSNPTIVFTQSGTTTVGARIFISTSEGFNYLKFKADNKYLVFRQAPSSDANATAYFYGEEDGKTSLGASSFRWYRVYAANSTISTSDKRQKKNIKPLKDVKKEHKKPNGRIEEADIYGELFDKLEPTEYNFIEGDNKKNFGLIAQDVLESMNELGIEEDELDLVHHDTWTDEKTGETKDSYGIAYENLIPLLIYEVQKLKGKVN